MWRAKASTRKVIAADMLYELLTCFTALLAADMLIMVQVSVPDNMMELFCRSIEQVIH